MREHDEFDEFDEREEREERDEEYARRILSEIRHIEAEESEAEESETTEGETTEERADEPKEGRRSWQFKRDVVLLLFSGNVLLSRGITKYYGQMIIVASLFLLSIVVMFWSLHLDMRHNKLSQSVQLLRERSVRMQETRSSRSSHSAIVRELERRDIELYDPATPAVVIERRRGLEFWR